MTSTPAEPSWSGPDPTDITAWTIVQAGHAVGRRFWQLLGEVGVSPMQFGVLLNLDLSPGLSNAQLARSVLVTPQTMSELMVSLEQAGLVERDVSQGRGRPITARLTAAGRAQLARCVPVVAEVEASLGLAAAAMDRLRGDLQRIVAGGSAV